MQVEVGGKIVELPDDYDPRTANDEYMCDKHRAYFKVILQKWLEETQKKLNAEIQVEDIDRRSNDEIDAMSIEVDTLKKKKKKDRLRKLAIKIEENIHKIDMDTYGYCEESGNEIGINRLIMRPICRYCVEIQEKKEREEAESEYIDYNQDEKPSKEDNDDWYFFTILINLSFVIALILQKDKKQFCNNWIFLNYIKLYERIKYILQLC